VADPILRPLRVGLRAVWPAPLTGFGEGIGWMGGGCLQNATLSFNDFSSPVGPRRDSITFRGPRDGNRAMAFHVAVARPPSTRERRAIGTVLSMGHSLDNLVLCSERGARMVRLALCRVEIESRGVGTIVDRWRKVKVAVTTPDADWTPTSESHPRRRTRPLSQKNPQVFGCHLPGWLMVGASQAK
jgi:hypothetical protein